MTNKTGSATQTVYYSDARLKRMDAARKRQEKKWAALAGPVTIRQVGEAA